MRKWKDDHRNVGNSREDQRRQNVDHPNAWGLHNTFCARCQKRLAHKIYYKQLEKFGSITLKKKVRQLWVPDG